MVSNEAIKIRKYLFDWYTNTCSLQNILLKKVFGINSLVTCEGVKEVDCVWIVSPPPFGALWSISLSRALVRWSVTVWIILNGRIINITVALHILIKEALPFYQPGKNNYIWLSISFSLE